MQIDDTLFRSVSEMRCEDIRSGKYTHGTTLSHYEVVAFCRQLRDGGWKYTSAGPYWYRAVPLVDLATLRQPFQTIEALPSQWRGPGRASKSLLRRTRAALRMAGYRRVIRRGVEMWINRPAGIDSHG